MSTPAAASLFCVCFAVSVISSLVLAERIDQLGAWLRLSEGLAGLLTALAADAPEITSAATAIIGGNRDLGLGVVFGSNIFNLAALLGLGAVTAGCVRVGRAGLWFDGGAGFAVAMIVAVRLFGWAGNTVSVTLLLLVVIPYLLISAIKTAFLEKLPISGHLQFVLRRIVAGTEHEKRKDQTPEKPSTTDLLGVVPSLLAVVVASVGMVDSALVLGNQWKISHVVIGTLVLATLTGIPNTLSAVRLARRGRGTAVVSETLNSNSVNLIAGALLPVLIFGLGALTSQARMTIIWSLAMTVLALILASRRKGLTRAGGSVLLLVYVAFVGVVIFWR
jgi:cation:H+ antiporter